MMRQDTVRSQLKQRDLSQGLDLSHRMDQRNVCGREQKVCYGNPCNSTNIGPFRTAFVTSRSAITGVHIDAAPGWAAPSSRTDPSIYAWVVR